eukprot:scaffold283067_cov17-Prasinocladus_malaysianus.AAC.1
MPQWQESETQRRSLEASLERLEAELAASRREREVLESDFAEERARHADLQDSLRSLSEEQLAKLHVEAELRMDVQDELH